MAVEDSALSRNIAPHFAIVTEIASFRLSIEVIGVMRLIWRLAVVLVIRVTVYSR